MTTDFVYLFIIMILTLLLYEKSSAFKYYLKFLVYSVGNVFSATIFIPLMFLKPCDYRNGLLPAWGSRQVARFLGIKLEIRGQKNIVQDEGCVVLINHQSIIDLFVVAAIWPVMERCTVISKKAVFYYWPFGLAAWLWGTVFIDRSSKKGAQDEINKTTSAITSKRVYPFSKFKFTVMDNQGTPAYNTRSKANVATVLNKDVVPPSEAETTLGPMGHSTQMEFGGEILTDSEDSLNVSADTHLTSIIEGINEMVNDPSQEARICIFPEGTRNDGEKLLPFKKGAFHIAIDSQAPIQPIVVKRYTFLDYKTCRFDEGSSIISILPPISTKSLNKDDINALLEKTYKIMSDEYVKLNTNT